MELAEKRNIPVEEKVLRVMMYILRRMFLDGNSSRSDPLLKVDGRTIGSGKPGEITRTLIRLQGTDEVNGDGDLNKSLRSEETVKSDSMKFGRKGSHRSLLKALA